MKAKIRHFPKIQYLLMFQIIFSLCVGNDKATNSSLELYRIDYFPVLSPLYAVCRQDANAFNNANSTVVDRRQGYSLTVYNSLKNTELETHPRADCSLSKDIFEILSIRHLKNFVSAKGNKNPIIEKNTFNYKLIYSRIILSGNAIQTVELEAFGCQPHLEILDLSDNYMESLPVDVFDCMVKLKYLYLSGNRIGELLEGMFDILHSLRMLDLTYNLITQLPKRIFNNNTILQELQLSSNRLQSFSANILHLGRLEILNVSRNCLSRTLSLRVPESLRNISVSSNKLTDIKWSDFRSVRTFCAKNNEIESLSSHAISQTEIRYIHLEGNKIRRLFLDSNFLKNLPEFKNFVFLSGNPLSCDCRAFGDYENQRKHLLDEIPLRYYPVHFPEGLICRNPPELIGREMLTLLPGDFTCQIREYCPENCRCVKIAYSGSIIVNCSRTGLTHLPLAVPRNANILHVDQNNLTSLASLNETRFEKLTEVHARMNQISSKEFFVPRNLKLLFLDGNRLTTIPETVRSQIDRTKDFRITLSGNKWPCECSSLPLKSFLSTHTAKVVDAYQIRCIFNDGSLNNSTFLEMRVEDFCASNSSWLSTRRVVVLTIGSVGILLMAIYNKLETLLLALLYAKCNWMNRLLRCRTPTEERKSFDCFLSYGSEDSDVAFAIANELEDRPLFPLTFCLHERNWKGGAYITDSIFLSVEHCRKTLIIVSRTFVKNKWFRLEFQAALIQALKDRRDRIILVLKRDMPDRSDLPRDVRHFLDSRTYLVWGERWFFEKLKYSLQDDTVSLKEILRDILLAVANGLRSRRSYREDV